MLSLYQPSEEVRTGQWQMARTGLHIVTFNRWSKVCEPVQAPKRHTYIDPLTATHIHHTLSTTALYLSHECSKSFAAFLLPHRFSESYAVACCYRCQRRCCCSNSIEKDQASICKILPSPWGGIKYHCSPVKNVTVKTQPSFSGSQKMSFREIRTSQSTNFPQITNSKKKEKEIRTG